VSWQWIAAGLLAAYLLGRRRSHPPAYPPQAWGAPPARRPSAKGVLVVVVLLAGLLTGAGVGTPADGKGGPRLGGMIPDLPKIGGGAGEPSPKAARAVRYALAQVGKPYVWGAEGPGSFDCSGLTWRAWQHAGVAIPRTAAGQLQGLPRVRGKLRAGDLVIYRTNGPSRRHVAMVVAPRLMVEARRSGVPVKVTRLRGAWLGAVRPGGR
jgi:hypothetical protein